MTAHLGVLAALVALILVFAIPAGFPCGAEPTATPPPCIVLEPGMESGRPCRLEITAGPDTRFDRGSLEAPHGSALVVGSFRYWQEPSATALYVYDDVQNLVGRVVNPGAVRMVVDTARP